MKEFFYRLGIPWELSLHFSLEELTNDELCQVRPDIAPELISQNPSCKMFAPVCIVLPMGFSWSFYFAQEALRCLIRRAVPSIKFIEDRNPIGLVQPDEVLALAYADNGSHYGLDREAVDACQECVTAMLHTVGLETHEVTEASSCSVILGGILDGENLVLRPKAERLAKLIGALNMIIKGTPIWQAA